MGWTDIAADGTRTPYYAVTDQLGSVTAVTDANAKMVWSSNYDPFGKTSGAIGLYDFDGSFAGHEVDADTGLIYMWNRWQDPETGRFLSEDPARADANYYSYVGNNPINKWDPTGLKQAEGANDPEGDSEADEQTMSTVDPVQASEESGSSSDSETKSGGSTPPTPQNVTDPNGLQAGDSTVPPKVLTNRPVATGTVSSPYGTRTDVDTGTVGSFHSGVDYAVPKGTPVVAAGNGTVTDTGNSPFYENYVMIDHGNGLTTLSEHLSSVSVEKGDTVVGGGGIGASGNTGTAAGGAYHLHLSVYETEKFKVVDKVTGKPTTLTSDTGRIIPKDAVDPALYLPKEQ